LHGICVILLQLSS